MNTPIAKDWRETLREWANDEQWCKDFPQLAKLVEHFKKKEKK